MDRRKIAALLVSAGLLAHAFFVPLSIAGMQIALGVAAAGVVLANLRWERTPLDLPICAFVAVCVASDLLSPYGAPTLAFATLWRSALGFFVVAQGLRSAPFARRLAGQMIACACAGLVLGALAGLVQYRTGLDPVHALHLRAVPVFVDAPGVPGRFGAMGFFTSRLTFGHNAMLVLALAGGALAASVLTRAQRWLAGLACALGLLAVAATFDRGAYLGLLAAAAALAVLAAPRARRVLLPALAALLLALALAPGVGARFRSAFSTGGNADRLFLWTRASEIIRDHPLAGIGFANYPRVCPEYYDRVDPGFPMRTWAHNLELSTLAETGPLGLLALLWVLLAAALALLRSRGRSGFAPGALAALAAFLAAAQAHDILYDTKVMYALWLPLGLALSPAWRATAASPAAPPARGG